MFSIARPGWGAPASGAVSQGLNVPEGLCTTEGVEVELAAAESQRPVLPLDDGEERGEGLCWLTHWATAKPAREEEERQS